MYSSLSCTVTLSPFKPQVHAASHSAGTDPAGEFRKAVGLEQPIQRVAAGLPQPEHVVPFGNQIVQRAAGEHAADLLARLAEGHAAVHASRRLLPALRVREAARGIRRSSRCASADQPPARLRGNRAEILSVLTHFSHLPYRARCAEGLQLGLVAATCRCSRPPGDGRRAIRR